MRNIAILCFVIFGLSSSETSVHEENNVQYVHSNSKNNAADINYIQIHKEEPKLPIKLKNSRLAVQYVISKPVHVAKLDFDSINQQEHSKSNSRSKSTPRRVKKTFKHKNRKTKTSTKKYDMIPMYAAFDTDESEEEMIKDISIMNKKKIDLKQENIPVDDNILEKLKYNLKLPTLGTSDITRTTESNKNIKTMYDDVKDIPVVNVSANKRKKIKQVWSKVKYGGSTNRTKFTTNQSVTTARTDSKHLLAKDSKRRVTPLEAKSNVRSFWPGIPEWWWKTFFDNRDRIHENNY